MSKAQAALEFITTYGWAITIIVIVMALIYILVTLPSNAAPSTCQFAGSVYCNDMILQYNSVTKAVNMIVLITNSQPYPVAKPKMFASISNSNTTAVACYPNYVIPGGSMVCTLPIIPPGGIGSLVDGRVYLNASYCGLQYNYSQANLCALAPREIYTASFTARPQLYPQTSPASVTLYAVNSTQALNGALDPLIANVMFFGHPLPGAVVNFTTNSVGYTVSPTYTLTNTTGQALSYITGTSPGNVVVSVWYNGTPANAMVQFVSK